MKFQFDLIFHRKKNSKLKTQIWIYNEEKRQTRKVNLILMNY